MKIHTNIARVMTLYIYIDAALYHGSSLYHGRRESAGRNIKHGRVRRKIRGWASAARVRIFRFFIVLSGITDAS